MFGRRKEEGETATGLVVDNRVTDNLLQSLDDRTIMADSKQHLTLTVTYADGTVADGVQTVVKKYGLRFFAGENVPLRVDAEDRSKVEVDIDLIKSTHKAEAEAGVEWNREMGELQRKHAAGEVSEEEWTAEAERMLFEDD